MKELRHGVKLKTEKSIQVLEAWLGANCRGSWRVDLDGFSDDLKKKEITVLFESEEDVKKFNGSYKEIDKSK